ncbi:zinc finger CCCH domain-containing protein 1-like protein, partial [Tanacetum coccineum]
MSESNNNEPQQKPEQQVCNFFRKPSKNKNIRKRANEIDDNQQEEPSLVIPKKKTVAPDNKLHFSTGSTKRSLEQEDVDTKATMFQFESSKEIQVQNDSRATATLETETDFSRDARAIRERVLKQANEALKGKGGGNVENSGNDEKLYKGIHGYTDYKAGFRREQTVASEKAGGSHGPLRASAHIRVSARFDYQPDICKDYKETGYCGYGDSCKFMHDRGDYKSGWQMERDWDEAEKVRKRKLALKGGDDDDDDEDEEEEIEDDEDGLPFACFICRQPFVDPVVTKCKHYFCEHCALKQLGDLNAMLKHVMVLNARRLIDGLGIVEQRVFVLTFLQFIKSYFWEDLWHGDMVLKPRYPRLYALEVKKTVDVASKLSQENLTWSFRRAPRSGVEQDQLTDLTTYVEGVVLGVTPDMWYWTLDGSGEFSVASARKVIDDNRFPEVSTQTRWIKAVPIKVNIHAWKVRMDCLPTRLNISRRGIDIPSILCPVCGSVTES